MIVDLFKSNFEKYKSFGLKVSQGIFYRGLLILINLLTGIIITRELLETGRGQYQLFLTSLIFFNTFLNFGFNQSATYFAAKEPEKIKEYLSSNLILTIGSIIVILFSIIGMSHYFPFQSDGIKYLFVVCYIFYSFSLIFRSFMAGKNFILETLKIDFYLRFGFLIFTGICYCIHHLSVFNIVLYLTLEYLIFSFITYKKINIDVFPLKLNWRFFKDTLAFNSKSFISTILIILLMKGDQYFIKYFHHNAAVGLYTIGNTLIENFYIFSSMITAFAIPKFLGSKDFNQLIHDSKKALLVIFTSSVFIAICIYIFSPMIIELFLKRYDEVAIESMRILSIGFVSWSVFIYIQYIYLSIRFKKSFLLIILFCLILNFGMNYVYLPKYGIIASAWASSICYSLLLILCYIDLFILKKNNFLKKQDNI